MLEKVKEILIHEQKQIYSQKLAIESKIEKLEKEERSLKQDEEQIKIIEIELNKLLSSIWYRLFYIKRIYEKKNKYQEAINNKYKKLEKISKERNAILSNLCKILHPSYDLESIIKKIENATTIKEMGITEKKALLLLEKNLNPDYRVIIKVLTDIKNTQNLKTGKDIQQIMHKLYQVNSSSFVKEMNKVVPNELFKQLTKYDIMINKDKIEFVNEIIVYIMTQDKEVLPDTKKIKCKDILDEIYKKEVQKILENHIRYPNSKLNIISFITTLTVLTSIAKASKQNK